MDRILESIRQGNLREVRNYIRKGFSLHPTIFLDTALTSRQYEIAEYLILKVKVSVTNVFKCNGFTWSPIERLFCYCEVDKNKEKVQHCLTTLLNAKADIDRFDYIGIFTV